MKTSSRTRFTLLAAVLGALAPRPGHADPMTEAYSQARAALGPKTAAPSVPAITAILEAPAPPPPLEGAWEAGKVPLDRLVGLRQQLSETLSRLPAALEKQTPPAEAAQLLQQLERSSREIAGINGLKFPPLPPAVRVSRTCHQQGPWADRVFYLEDVFEGTKWWQEWEIGQAWSNLDGGDVHWIIKAAADSLAKPGPASSQVFRTGSFTVVEEVTKFAVGPFRWKGPGVVDRPIEQPMLMFIQQRIAKANAHFEWLIALARDVQANGPRPVPNRYSLQSRYRPRDGEQPPVSSGECPHNGVN